MLWMQYSLGAIYNIPGLSFTEIEYLQTSLHVPHLFSDSYGGMLICRISSAFANRRRRYKELGKKVPQARPRMYLLYILELRVRNANSIRLGTTAVRGGFDTSRTVCSSGMDAALINQKRCFAVTRNS